MPHRLSDRHRVDAGAILFAVFVVALTAWVVLTIASDLAGGIAGWFI